MMKSKNVLVLILPNWPQSARLLKGVMAFAKAKGGWTLARLPESVFWISHIKGWKGDGIMAWVPTRQDARLIRKFGVPTVHLGGGLPEGILPRVMTDNVAIGRMAAEHLLECRFKRFAFVARKGSYAVAERLRGFAEMLAAAGFKPMVFEVPSFSEDWRTWVKATKALERFLGEIPRPFAVMGCDDMRAKMALDTCDVLGLKVPDEVGIVGVDNNEFVCEFSSPTLSSVQRADFETGYRAAELLDRLMNGAGHDGCDVLLPPPGVAKRMSTRVLAVEDPLVRMTLDYIRDHIEEPFGAERLVEISGTSRRWLERRFKSEMHCTLHEHLTRARLESAKEMILGGEKRRMLDIAAACGFPSATRFRLLFKRIEGTTPRAYARKESPGRNPVV